MFHCGEAILSVVLLLTLVPSVIFALREFRPWSNRTKCQQAQSPNYVFAYSKYDGQVYESKSRVNTNLQDFRHTCQLKGGRSKCHICENIECESDVGTCALQLQGVNSSLMSYNIPAASDTSWAVGGWHRKDYGNRSTTHACVFITGGDCVKPNTTDFSNCRTRCFGYGFNNAPRQIEAPYRSHVDVYDGMGKWEDDGAVDLWVYPRNCSELSQHDGQNCTYSQTGDTKYKSPSFNPQGFTFTWAGTGAAGFEDGNFSKASFREPRDLAVDSNGYIFVADTLNNAIRMISPNKKKVSTITGLGIDYAGFHDGACAVATFTQPTGIDVKHDSSGYIVVIVADTGNHRIRQVRFKLNTRTDAVSDCYTRCLTGLCGNNTISASDYKNKATPFSGYADGTGLEARFSAPESVAFLNDDIIIVADTGNYLIRWVHANNGSTYTLAGSIIPGETDEQGNPLAGCMPPCLRGEQGYRDGDLSTAQFFHPADVTRGPNNTIWVADDHRVRLIELPGVTTFLYSVKSMGRVSTIAGDVLQGHEDGAGENATFFSPAGIFVTGDNYAYVVDSAACRVRRITPAPLVAQQITCKTTPIDIIRPSGCTSFDQAIDKVGRKVSRVEGNIQYNLGWPYENDLDRGKYMKNCVGVPPLDTLDKHFIFPDGDNLVVDDHRVYINEDSEQGTAILVNCPGSCASASYSVEGTKWYSDNSSICMAAIHDGKLPTLGGMIQITLQRRAYIWNTTYDSGSTSNGITSYAISEFVPRIFKVEYVAQSVSMVHTIAGHPAAPLESACSFRDSQPPVMSYFNGPQGVATIYGSNLSDVHYLYIADTKNHRIRAISAVCTFICENGGRCIGNDVCDCPTGWGGVDCTIPSCTTTCGKNKVCVAPDTCACKPGYGGSNCDMPLCVQTCHNGGRCTAPDTCTCPTGWFDSNCTTPVCSQTCANGGNCTAPDTCACPTQWQGSDCRIPVCEQTCKNKGFCVAPNTCQCPPQYINYDCSVPVCHQGFFKPNPDDYRHHLYATNLRAWPTFKNCNLPEWCNATKEFECYQLSMSYGNIDLPWGPEGRYITGRKEAPNQCMVIELPLTYRSPFMLSNSDNTTSGYRRFIPLSPYTSSPSNPWKGFTSATEGHTGPWTYEPDRQVANVNWLNVSQGVYVCANGGNCTAPDVCECAPGWIGFDCRTPVCSQGYYHKKQARYVSGLETSEELSNFRRFMGNNSYRLHWPYSNPNYTIQIEHYNGSNSIVRFSIDQGGVPYEGPSDWSTGVHLSTKQGGYRCSIRSVTQWENVSFVLSHPNYYSLYMDSKRQADGVTYTQWSGMYWPPVHRKSRVLRKVEFNITFEYSNEGWRRFGIWNTTANKWEYGTCIMEFKRTCQDPSKEYDLVSNRSDVYVQDTDLAFRPRVYYNDYQVYGEGRWYEYGGECVDHVLRGCYNNGTCVGPGICICAEGWTGEYCNIPICEQQCNHHGNCTLPNRCTCERGWSGDDCSIPMCAQECQNGGLCVAPDTCKCNQWWSAFRDGRVDGGRPLFQDEFGFPQYTGWTGYDCSVPICVQAEAFYINTPTSPVSLGGHGGDGLLPCIQSDGRPAPRCPLYDRTTSSNDGKSYQTGCGYDPYDTGCCVVSGSAVTCYRCIAQRTVATNNTFFCQGNYTQYAGKYENKAYYRRLGFLDENSNYILCGKYYNPRYHTPYLVPQDYGVAQYYFEDYYLGRTHDATNFNFRSNYTSNRFLCNVDYWYQGDYVDDAGLGKESGMGSTYGLAVGRHPRINTPNLAFDIAKQKWYKKSKLPGEGVYGCYNQGSCIGPDTCTCTDGYSGYDCQTPLCRHLRPTGEVTSCLNGGTCVSRDNCKCVQTQSVLWRSHKDTPRGVTGWTGNDCSIPMCSQGYFDPFCTDLPQAPAGQGCYRCSNGGNCTAPDVCTCAPGWTGFDCKTPVCEVVADPLTRIQLGTVYEDKVISFESDPCGVIAIYGIHGWKGRKYTRGNCTQPNQCTCLCKEAYIKKACHKLGTNCEGSWQDPLVDIRNVLEAHGPEYTFGSTVCHRGYEGNTDELDHWTTCHQTIYVPSQTEKDSLTLIISMSVVTFSLAVIYYLVSARLRRKFLLAKIERRRSKRSSDDSILKPTAGAFSGQ